MAKGRLNLMDPPIEDLLDKVDSKFTLVALGALRARQVNAYYNSLGEGLGRVVPPQVVSVSGKPLSIAFEEVAASKATYVRFDPDEVVATEAEEGTEAVVATETLGALEVRDTLEVLGFREPIEGSVVAEAALGEADGEEDATLEPTSSEESSFEEGPAAS